MGDVNIQIDPNLIVGAALTALDEIISLVKHIKAQGGMTDDQIAAHADAQDVQNLADIQALLALKPVNAAPTAP